VESRAEREKLRATERELEVKLKDAEKREAKAKEFEAKAADAVIASQETRDSAEKVARDITKREDAIKLKEITLEKREKDLDAKFGAIAREKGALEALQKEIPMKMRGIEKASEDAESLRESMEKRSKAVEQEEKRLEAERARIEKERKELAETKERALNLLRHGEKEAEAVLVGTVQAISLVPVSLTREGLTLETRATVGVNVTLKRMGNGKDIWQAPNLNFRQDYLSNADFPTNERRKEEALRRIARELGASS